MSVISQYQTDNNLDDRTDAVEGIIRAYKHFVNKPASKIRRALFGDEKTKPLEVFSTAQA